MEPRTDLESAIQQSSDRLFPSLRDPNYLVLSKRRKLFTEWLSTIAGDQLEVLDIGGRLQPYRPLVEKRAHRYVAVDVRRTQLVSVVARGEALPLAAGSFDLVICTQVLQVIRQPLDLIAEIRRVLKPEGFLLLSTSAAEPLTTEFDYWRFTPASLRWLLKDFSHVEVAPEGNSVAAFFRTTNVYFDMFARSDVLRTALKLTLVPFLNAAGLFTEKLSASSNHQFSVNYSVFARK